MRAKVNEQKFDFANIFNQVKNTLFGRSNSLKFFYDVVGSKRISASHFSGTQDVNLNQIVGSMNAGRCKDFDANFKLLKSHSRARLAGVAQAWKTKSLPPVSLIQFENHYYVQDGHHRLAVAASSGQTAVKANVTIVTLVDSGSGSGLTAVNI